MASTLLHVTPQYIDDGQELKGFCSSHEVVYKHADGELEALEIMLDYHVDVVIINTLIGVEIASELVGHIQVDVEHSQTPIILIAPNYKGSLFSEKLDFPSIIASFNYPKYTNHLHNLLLYLFTSIKRISQLTQELNNSEVRNVIDALTGVKNRFGGEDAFSNLLARHEAYHEPFSIIMMDIDHFKKVNDTYGHDIGDEVLISFTKAIKQIARHQDTLIRLGGEEFALLLADCDLIQADQSALRIQKHIKSLEHSSKKLHITASFGVVEYKEGESMEQTLKRADELLYIAKESGRDKVVSTL